MKEKLSISLLNIFICHFILKIITRLPQVLVQHVRKLGFPGGSGGKELSCNSGNQVLIPGWGRSVSPGGRVDQLTQLT